MEIKISATEETKSKLESIKARSLEIVAELQLLEVDMRSVLLEGQEATKLAKYVTGYDFDTHEFIVDVSEIDIDTEEGKKALAAVLGVDEVVGIVTP